MCKRTDTDYWDQSYIAPLGGDTGGAWPVQGPDDTQKHDLRERFDRLGVAWELSERMMFIANLIIQAEPHSHIQFIS